MVDRGGGYIPEIHVTICHGFDERIGVGSPTFPRIINMECLPLAAYEEGSMIPTFLPVKP